MTRRPDSITFTGIDAFSNLDVLTHLSETYPIEWGVLISATRTGVDSRYPAPDVIEKFISRKLPMALHICGQYARSIMDGERVDVGVDITKFRRVQVNHTSPNPERLAALSTYFGVPVVAQWRDPVFPVDARVDWLYDLSGGRGLQPMDWPPYPDKWCGYAGGISVGNVATVIETIGATGPYWIDLESNVRTASHFDTDIVKKVCIAVYGDK